MGLNRLLEAMLAHYVTGGKIIAKEGTLGYYHELRHKYQEEHKMMAIEEFGYWFLGGLTLVYWNPLPLCLHFGYRVGMEIDCWWSAVEQKRLNP